MHSIDHFSQNYLSLCINAWPHILTKNKSYKYQYVLISIPKVSKDFAEVDIWIT